MVKLLECADCPITPWIGSCDPRSMCWYQDPCDVCGGDTRLISFETHEIVQCKTCHCEVRYDKKEN